MGSNSIISSEKYDNVVNELKLTKLQLNEALKKVNELEAKNKSLTSLAKKLTTEKRILRRALMILSEEEQRKDKK